MSTPSQDFHCLLHPLGGFVSELPDQSHQHGAGAIPEGAMGSVTNPPPQGAAPEGAPMASTSPPRADAFLAAQPTQGVPCSTHTTTYVEKAVIVDRPVPMPIQVPVPVDRIVHVPVPVDRIVEVRVPYAVPVERMVPFHTPFPVHIPFPFPMSAQSPAPPAIHQEQHLHIQAPPPRLLLPPPPRLALPPPPEPTPPDTLLLLPPPNPPLPQPCRNEPILLGWRDADDASMEPTGSKRTADDADLDSTPNSPNSPPSLKPAKAQKKELWPAEWQVSYKAFATTYKKNEAKRREMWDKWPQELRQQAYCCVSPNVRALMEQWWAEELAAQSTPSSTNTILHAPAVTPPNPEQESHDWKKGARIGEASNPGPKGHNRHSGSREPGLMPNSFRTAPARQHGARAAPPRAGEQAKRDYPGPKPLADHARGPHGGNGPGKGNSAAMRPTRPSRAGSAQRNPPPSPHVQQSLPCAAIPSRLLTLPFPPFPALP